MQGPLYNPVHDTDDVDKLKRDLGKAYALLRRMYDPIEHHVLNNTRNRILPPVSFCRFLGKEVQNFLGGKDQHFRDIVLKRQKRYRTKQRVKEAIIREISIKLKEKAGVPLTVQLLRDMKLRNINVHTHDNTHWIEHKRLGKIFAIVQYSNSEECFITG